MKRSSYAFTTPLDRRWLRGLLRHLAGDRVDVFSAGIEAGSLRPEAVAAMKKIGVDISTQRSKSLDEYAGQPFDVVVTTCDEAKEALSTIS